MKPSPRIPIWFLIPLVLWLWWWSVHPALCGEDPPQKLTVPLGGSVVLRVTKVEQVAIGDPQIADVVVLSSEEVLINGKKAGTTTLHLWTARGQVDYQIEVQLRPGLEEEIRQAIGLPEVQVEIREGAVVLRGRVRTAEQSTAATEVARLYVDHVINLIQLASETAAVPPEETARRIAEALQDPHITVQVIKDSALLQGTVATPAASQRAEKVAKAFVNQVINAIQVAPSPEPSTPSGQEAAAQIRAVQEAIGLPGVTVELRQGALVLRGQVEKEAQRTTAEQIARLYAESVINLLTVAAPPPPSPEELAAQISRTLGEPGVQVEVLKDTAFLRGTVATEAEAARAEKVAAAFTDKVVNLLQVRSAEAPPPATSEELQRLLGNKDISVQVIGNAVLLQGVVGSEAEKETAAQTAQIFFPRVVNALRVQEKRLPDEVITAQLQELIPWPGVEAQAIRGRVVLRGTVASQAQVQSLLEAARVYSDEVINLLQVREPSTPERLAQMRQVLEGRGISLQQVDQMVILQGKVPDEEALKDVKEFAQALGSNVVNLVHVGNQPQVKVEVQILEVNRKALKNLGIEWNDSFVFGEALLGGAFKRLTNVQGTLNTLLENRQARLLSAPTLTVLSGEEAKILVGGRIPLPTTTFLTGVPEAQTRQSDGGGFFGGIGQGITWEEYGIRLGVTPRVEGGEVRMEIKPEVSDLDNTNAIDIQGTRIPAMTTRQSETTVQVRSGQAIVIGGLIKNDVTKKIKKFPFLGDLPILGALFRSESFERNETELLITVTPTILPKEGNEG